MVDLCDFLLENTKNLSRWRNLWTTLLFTIGIATTIFIIVVLALITSSKTQPWLNVSASVGTVIQGTAVAWLSKKRNEARKEELAAIEYLKQNCRETATFISEDPSKVKSYGESAEKFSRKLKLFKMFY
jgi:cytochrome c biogenesis protein CcdA